ncbi:MAG: M48 family metallopeptidase [Microscillaceae bacterium]|nr:M48 family metallopeptidase [Microscillaceae bacterium]
MTAHTILIVILVIFVFDFVLDTVLSYLNLCYKKNGIPPELEGIYTPENYQKSLDYQRIYFRFSLLARSLSFVLMMMMLLSGAFGWIYDTLGNYFSNPIWQGLAFFAVLGLGGDILSLPLQLYSIFVIEEKFGFNKNTLSNFFVDKLKGYLLGALLGGLIGYAFFYLVIHLEQNFWILFWVIFMAFSLFMNAFYTTLLLPLFNKLTPLEDGELRQAIEQYCQKVKFPLTNLFVMDGSRRSTKANAFFSGIGKRKKIVLFDTLIEKHTLEELVAVLAHEVGHYKKRHIPQSIILSAIQMGVILYILSLFIFNLQLSLALGSQSLGIALNLMAFSFLFSPISMIIGLFFNVLSRKNEFEADRFARDTYHGDALSQALKKLSADNLSNLNPHPLYVFFNYSHPPLLQRLKALRL